MPRWPEEQCPLLPVWADPLAKLVRAGLLSCEGEHDGAVKNLVEAITGFEAADISLYAMGGRRCQGRLIAGPRGRELVREAEEGMTGQGIKRPDQIARVLAPGN